jgi:hypothetical protein
MNRKRPELLEVLLCAVGKCIWKSSSSF